MQIPLDEQYFIAPDDVGVQLVRRVITQEGPRTKQENIGKERTVVAGYYLNVRQACLTYLDRITVNDSSTAEGREAAQRYIAAIDEATTRIENAIKGLSNA